MDVDYGIINDFLQQTKYTTHTLQRAKRKTGKKLIKYQIIAFDTEDDGKGNATMMNFYDGKENTLFEFYNGKHTLKDALNFVYNYKSKLPCIFFAHNLEYDLVHLVKWKNYAPINDMLYTSRLITANLLECSHSFWDSFNLYPVKLKIIGDSVGIEKGDFFEASKDWDDLKEYVKTDTLILWTFVEKFQEKINRELGIKIFPTIGKMCMEVYRTKFLKEDIRACSKDICIDAYYGGRCEVYYKGNIKGDICICDINSQYPFVMTWDYPNTDRLEGSRIDTHEFGVGKFEIYVPKKTFVPPLPYRKNGRLYFPTSNAEGTQNLIGTWTYAEVRHAVECGCKIINEWEGIGTNFGEPYLKAYINHFYKDRLVAKEVKDKFGDTYNKRKMTNLYGKLFQHTDKIRISTQDNKRPNEELVKILGDILRVYKEPCIEPPGTSNYLWGIYVTSYARIYYHKILIGLHNKGLLIGYGDTDSIIFERKKGVELPFTISKELGDLDIEEFEEATFINPKGYYLFKKPEYYIQCLVIPERGEVPLRANKNTEIDTRVLVRNKDDEDWKEALFIKKEKNSYKIKFYKLACKGVPTDYGLDFLKEGVAYFKKPIKMRQSFIQDMEANFWDDVEKRSISTYIKRKGEGVTYPISVDEIPAQEELLKKHIANINKMAV